MFSFSSVIHFSIFSARTKIMASFVIEDLIAFTLNISHLDYLLFIKVAALFLILLWLQLLVNPIRDNTIKNKSIYECYNRDDFINNSLILVFQ